MTTHTTPRHDHEPDSSAAADETPQHKGSANPDHPGHAGHDRHGGHGGHGDHVTMFRRRFWWSLLLTIPVVVTSHMVMDWLRYDLEFYGMDWVGPVVGSVIFFWAAGDDAADRHGHHRRLCRVVGHELEMVRPRVLVGAGRAHHHHAAGPLAG